ncbi:hypothetical protein POV26_13800 [Aequorivita todarodis]|uniref:hypothetical protein n=1 Tax=Aequorivita todarodis TaxID=2036821 RepID=UPI00234FD4A5|nr:hypothetical protein [Aequorivita todarodis]MDC8002116.1 hypothetical protein [Aequorivita todarodis]
MKNSYRLPSLLGRLFLFTILFFPLTIQAQVGIGNTNPDASSVLDITSTSKGLLLPRMTTAQRLAITTPANSLMVYDTTVKAYFYYDTVSATWVRINSAFNQRNNYVLVKTAADLPAPSGGKITLVSNTLYEINGTITITAPIDLNDAYVAGLDANEDILYKATGPVFQGTTGGSIRNVTITGGAGASAFNITGGNSLLVQNTIVANLSSVGTISNIGLYFGNIVQFVNNTTGITYNNIGNLLLSNQAWLDSNNGTFETFTGTFGLIEKVSGFSTMNGADIAIDVSSNPNVGSGVLLSTVFSGTTTAPGGFIKKYTTGSYPGYNFTNAWAVNCPGIPRESDDVATGDINLDAAVGSGELTTFTGTGSGSRIKVAGTTTSNNLFRFERVGNNRIVYRGAKRRFFQVNASVSYQASGDPTIILYIAKNGSVITQTKVYGRGATGFFVNAGILALPIIGTVELSNGDYIEIWAERYSGTGDMNTVSLNLTAR